MCLLCTAFGLRLEMTFPNAKCFASEDRPLLWGLWNVGEEEWCRKQSIGAKGASVLSVTLYLLTYVPYKCAVSSETVEAVLWPLALPLICPFLRDFRPTGPNHPANAGPVKPSWAVWVPPTHCSFLSSFLNLASIPPYIFHHYVHIPRICPYMYIAWILYLSVVGEEY